MKNAATARRMPARHDPRPSCSDRCRARRLRAVSFIVPVLCLAGCDGMQSTLAPSGAEADLIANTFWLMLTGALLIWLVVVAFAACALTADPERFGLPAARRVIVGGGIVLPVVVLTALLAYGLARMPDLSPALSADNLRVDVSGEQWWWRVRYRTPEGDVTLANEIRLPLGQRVEFRLTSPDVIHSFWIPSLAGKMDMTPGRTTTLVLTPTKTGVFRGACAEYCGASHARMNFLAVVMAPDEFERWLEGQGADAKTPLDALSKRGAQAFLANGCGACHAIRGTAADGSIGPDLTHVGSRLSLAAGTLSSEHDDFLRWIGHAQAIKPDVLMPSFGMLPDDELRAIAAYLDGLE